MYKLKLVALSLFALLAIGILFAHGPATSAGNLPAYAPVPFATPVASSFSTAVPANRQSAITLLGSDPDLTTLTYATVSGPTHGALSSLNTATGIVIYTPVTNYTGADSFTYTVTSGGQTSSAGTITLTVTNARTRIIDSIVDGSGAPRHGKVTFILTQVVTTPSGISPAGASVSASLSQAGMFDISIYPSRSMSPEAYYQVWFNDSSNLSRNELIGIYDIPLSSSTVALAPYKVTDTNLSARYTFASVAEVNAMTTAVASATLVSLLGSSPTDNALQKYKASTGGYGDSNISSNGSEATVTGNQTITGNQAVGGNQTVTGNQTVAGTQTSGASAVNGNQVVSGSQAVGSNQTVAGSVIARSFSGDGSGLTGIGGGTGGVINTGSTTVGADSDANGVGAISLQTGGLERINIGPDGTIAMLGQVFVKCGGTNDSAAINSAVTTASGSWVVITSGQTCAVSDVTIPRLRIERGGLLKPATGHSATISENFDAGPYPVFTNALGSQGTIIFTGTIKEEFPQWWGAKGDSSTDDTAAIQAAVNAAIAGSVRLRLIRTANLYKITSPIAISGQITITGDGQMNSGLFCFGVNAFNIATGAFPVIIEKLSMATTVRHTTTPNALVGIKINGTTGTHSQNQVYRDLFIDGFYKGFEAHYLWSTAFNNVKINAAGIGLECDGLCVNDSVDADSHILGLAGTSEIGIYFKNGAAEYSEGWMIANTVIDGFNYGIVGENTAHVFINNTIIDHNQLVGILLGQTGATYSSINWSVVNSYIGMNGAAGVAGIYENQTNTAMDPQDRGLSIIGVTIIKYDLPGTAADYGIALIGTGSKRAEIAGNHIRGFTRNDIRARTEATVGVHGNHCTSSVPNTGTDFGIYGGGDVSGNPGCTQYYQRATQMLSIGGMKFTYDEAAPTTGTWNKGDVCFNINATVGQPKGWVCTVSGSPGTWVSMGNL